MDNDYEQPVFLVDKTLKLYEIVLAALFYTIAFLILSIYIAILILYGVNMETFAQLPFFIAVFFIFFAAAVRNSEINQIAVDIKNKKLTHSLKIVFFNRKVTFDVGSFDYVAMNKFNFGTTITLWFKGNKRKELGVFYKKELALRYATGLAKLLKTDLLDKTNGKAIWIEYEKL